MKIFITGATGFIGSHLVSKLLARGDQLTCLVRNPDKAALLAQQGVTLVKGKVGKIEKGKDGTLHVNPSSGFAYGCRT